MIDQIQLFVLRAARAWRYRHRLGFSWRLAWAKAGSECGMLR